MKTLAIPLPKEAEEALCRLQRAGYAAYVVGGCVRDSILQREPNDWDLTTSALPAQTKSCFSDCRVIETGIRHGTVGVLLDGALLEITTFRNDGDYADNRHPVSVTFSPRIEDDLSRRDFTVNAMAYAPGTGLVDLFGGREDLEKGVIRCVGDPATRFSEDGLRILRALRFAAVLDFSIDEKTAEAVHTCRHLLDNIAAERIREEFCKLLCGKGAVRILREFVDVFTQFLPELGATVGFEQNTRYHCYDVFEHTLHALQEERTGDLCTRLGILLHDVGKPLCYTEDEEGGHFKGHAAIGVELTERILTRLRFDHATVQKLTVLVELHDLPIAAQPKAVKRLMRRLSDEDILRLMEIKRCDRLAHAEFFRTPPSEITEIPRIVSELRAADACLSLKDLALSGEDLLEMGIPKGKRVGKILNALLEAVLDERLPNEREALLTLARTLANEKSE